MKFFLLIFSALAANIVFAQRDFPDFLEGRWKTNGAEVFEQWDRIAAGGLKGIGYSTESGKLAVTEYLEISARGDETVYSAFVLGQNEGAAVDFVLSRADSLFVFENPDHDFPQRIAYHVLGEERIRVDVSGSGGKDFSLTMIRQAVRPATDTDNPEFDAALADKLGADDYGMKGYIMVILKTGLNESNDKELIAASFAGHMENIERLVEDGKIILAGPFYKHPTSGDENAEPYRGIFILEGVADFAEAEALMKSDPAVKAGFLAADFYHWYGSAALPAYLPFSDKVWKKRP